MTFLFKALRWNWLLRLPGSHVEEEEYVLREEGLGGTCSGLAKGEIERVAGATTASVSDRNVG